MHAAVAEQAVPGRNAIQWIRANLLLVVGMLAISVPTFIYVARESWSTEQGAHGPIVLATGLWLLVRQWRTALAERDPPPGWIVAALFIPMLFFYFVARTTQIVEVEGFVMYGTLVVVLFSMVGLQALKKMWFPLFYLLFVFPPPEMIIALITQPLKIGISRVAIDLLHLLGYPIAGAGVTIQIGQYQLLVAAACSGLNSLLSLSAISLFYVYMRHQANWRYAAILLLAIVPVAIFANFVRVLILILLTYHAGESAAQGFLHNFAGLTMFITALLSIFIIDSLAEPVWRRFNSKKVTHVG